MIMSTKEETKKGGVTMRGKNQNQDTNDPRKIPAEYLDENGNWRMLDRRERAMLTDGQVRMLSSQPIAAEAADGNNSF